MIVYLVCFDIEDDKARREMGKLLGRHGRRVQKSVFETMFSSEPQRIRVENQARALLDELDLLSFYRLCAHCQKLSHDQHDQALARFPRSIIV